MPPLSDSAPADAVEAARSRHDRTLAAIRTRTRGDDPRWGDDEPRGRRGAPRTDRCVNAGTQRRGAATRRSPHWRPPTQPTQQSNAATRLGPFHGVPITVKENIDLVGSPTTQGVVRDRRGPPTRRCTGHRTDEGSRCDSDRTNEPARLRPAGPHRLVAPRPHPQPAPSRSDGGRFERRRGSRDRDRHEPARARQRHRRLAAQPRALLRHRIDQALGRRRRAGVIAPTGGPDVVVPADGGGGHDGPTGRRRAGLVPGRGRPRRPRPVQPAGHADRTRRR